MRCPALVLQPLYLTSFSALPNMSLLVSVYPYVTFRPVSQNTPTNGSHLAPGTFDTQVLQCTPPRGTPAKSPAIAEVSEYFARDNDRARTRKRKRDENCLF